ncbi:hypothetical protein HDV00_003174 [Rhizophlyctis rosea]|nr:hypothetical protein HDV00_003174 [Rhizophlyctis rosea]
MEFSEQDALCLPGKSENVHSWRNRYAGYTIPRLVYWNLNGSSTVPVTNDEKNVVLVSGFSGQLFRLFTEGKPLPPETTPIDVLKKAIDGKYDDLKVID